MPDILTLSAYFYHVCGRRNLRLKAQKAKIWAGGNAGVNPKNIEPENPIIP